jgi:hypothetical protein
VRENTGDRPGWFYRPLVLFIFLRIAILILIYGFTGGGEFTSDTWVFNLALHPLSVITFSSDASLYSQPPLFPIFLAPLAIPLSKIAAEFLASRISYTIIEFLMFLVMAVLVDRSPEFTRKSRRAVMIILALSPLGFMTGAVMRQEEAIVAFFVAMVLLAVKNSRFRWAAVLVILGILTGKILFGIVFVALLIVARDKKEIYYWGILPAVVILSLYSLAGYLTTGVTPFLDFAPTAVPYCSSVFNFILYYIWMTGPFMKWVSLILLAAAIAVIWPLIRKTGRDDFPVVLLLVFCILFFIFYHINSEYYIFALPLLAISPYLPGFKFSRTAFNLLHFIFGIAAWGYGIVWGIHTYAQGNSVGTHSKDLVLSTYNRYLGFLPLGSLEKWLLFITLILILAFAAISFRHLRRGQLSPGTDPRG